MSLKRIFIISGFIFAGILFFNSSALGQSDNNGSKRRKGNTQKDLDNANAEVEKERMTKEQKAYLKEQKKAQKKKKKDQEITRKKADKIARKRLNKAKGKTSKKKKKYVKTH